MKSIETFSFGIEICEEKNDFVLRSMKSSFISIDNDSMIERFGRIIDEIVDEISMKNKDKQSDLTPN